MVMIPQNVVVVPGWPQKHAEDYTRMCTIITTVQAVLPYKCTIMLGKLTYINTLSLIVDYFPESVVTLDVESINVWFITLMSALFTALALKANAIIACVLHMYITHDCIIVLYGFKTLHSPLIW